MSTEAAAPPATGAEAKAAKGSGILLPLVAVFVVMPGLAYGLTQFVLIPKLRAVMPAAGAAGTADAKSGVHPEAAAGEGEKKAAPDAEAVKKAGEGAEASFEFKDIIVNLSGAMGTRYLKASFTVTGNTPKLPDVIKVNHQKLLDVAISILSSRTLNDLDSPTAKNGLREELIAKFNHSIGVEVIDGLYFSDFVVQ